MGILTVRKSYLGDCSYCTMKMRRLGITHREYLEYAKYPDCSPHEFYKLVGRRLFQIALLLGYQEEVHEREAERDL